MWVESFRKIVTEGPKLVSLNISYFDPLDVEIRRNKISLNVELLKLLRLLRLIVQQPEKYKTNKKWNLLYKWGK